MRNLSGVGASDDGRDAYDVNQSSESVFWTGVEAACDAKQRCVRRAVACGSCWDRGVLVSLECVRVLSCRVCLLCS